MISRLQTRTLAVLLAGALAGGALSAGSPAMAQAHAGHGSTADKGKADMGMADKGMADMGVKSSIADGAVLTVPPTGIRFDFGHPMRLTRVRLSTLTGQIVPVRFNVSATPTATGEASFDALPPDSYSLVWGADAGDHQMGATIRFTVR